MLKSLHFVLAILVTMVAAAQNTIPQYEHINVENGLPNSHVTKFLEDRFGYIWIGTENGLVRYDGYSKKLYKLETEQPQTISSLNIQELFEDSNGNIWIGTFYDGAFRYNRSTDKFDQFKSRPGNKTGLAGNDVHNISEDGAGNLYFYTYDHPKNQGNISQFNPKTGKFRLFSPDKKGKDHMPEFDTFLTSFKDKNGQIWMASWNGLYTFDSKTDQFKGYLTETDSTKQKTISRLYQSPSDPNILYFADLTYRNTLRGIVRFNTKDGRFETFQFEGLPANKPVKISSFFEDKQKRLWIGTNHGLSRLDYKTGKIASYELNGVFNGVKMSEIFAVTADNTGLLWLSIANGMLNFDPVTNQFTNNANLFREDIDPNRVYYFQNAFQDRAGNLWLKDREGVHKLKKEFSLFNHYKRDNSDSSSYYGGFLYSITDINPTEYLLAGMQGLFTWNVGTNKFAKFKLPKEIQKTDFILKVTMDQSRNLWGVVAMGNYNFKGLFSYNFDRKKVTFHKSIPGDSTTPSSDMVSCIFADSKNNVWIGSYNKGVSRYDPKSGKFTRFPFVFRETKKPNGELDDLTVNCIYEDKDGTVWVGTAKGGLNKYDPSTGKFISYFDTKKGLRQITAMWEDHKGRFWAASEVYGLHLFDRKTGKSTLFTEKDGLLSNGLLGIAEDRTGDLWLSTTRGLSRFDPETRSFRSFTKEQGLPDARLTTVTKTLTDGKILVSSYRGFFTFDPAKIVVNATPPLVHIESVSYILPRSHDSGESKPNEVTIPVHGLENLKLNHDQNRLKFDYIGLHFKNPAQNKYMYQLEGYENQWIKAGDQRSAIYTNLSPGTYVFKVKAANSDGVWNEKEARFAFEILPPWWATWWAYLLYVILFAVALRTYTYFRSRALLRENQLLEEKIGLRTQELSAANKELNAQRDQLTETVTELKSTQQQLIQSEKLASLGELTAGIAHEIQNPLNFVNNFSEVSVELAEEMEHELQNGDKYEAIAIAADIKQNLQKIMHHGQRAGGIVKSMLQHSRQNSGEKEVTDINDLTDEFLKLSYHGLRAKDNSFNAKMTTHFDPSIPKLSVIPQDIGRVLINLFNNAFYAVQQKQKIEKGDYKPELQVSTLLNGPFAEIRVRDNGIGIPDKIKDKILQPFFTTKPTGEGTGLGLSLSHDILKAHGGKMDIESKEGEFTCFTIFIPLS